MQRASQAYIARKIPTAKPEVAPRKASREKEAGADKMQPHAKTRTNQEIPIKEEPERMGSGKSEIRKL